MAAIITEEMLDVYAVTATWDEMPEVLAARYGGVASRLIFYFTDAALERGPEHMERWKVMLAKLKELTA